MSAAGTPERQRSCAVNPAQVELTLSQIESLPTLPGVAARLLELTSGDSGSASDVVRLIEADQSLSVRLLSAVARAGVGARADTVDRAVLLLGFDAVRGLVLSIQVFETFSQRAERASTRFDRVGFWRHSLAVGCAARLFVEMEANQATRAGRRAASPDEAFVCGLLHDIGKVALDACFPKSYDRVVHLADSNRIPIAEAERDVFGLDHTASGQRLAMHWKLPPMIRECIWLHHQTLESTPGGIEHPAHVRLIQAADRLARQMRIGYSGNHGGDDSLATTAAQAGVSPEVLERIVAALPEEIETRAELLGLDRVTSAEVYYEALAKTNAELSRVNVSLASANRQLERRSRCFEALRMLNTDLAGDPTLEDICSVGVAAAEHVLGCGPVVLFAQSATRGIAVIRHVGQNDRGVQGEVVPIPAVGDLSHMSDSGQGWVSALVLSGDLQDRLAPALGGPATWYWAIRHQKRLMGAIVIQGDRPADVDESMAALSDALGAWLGGAESRAVACRLNEQLADTNVRLLNSQHELARSRSLAMVGEMAAGAAHELNNPLAVISGRAQLLNRDEMDEHIKRVAVVIAEHAHKASAIVSELMDFAKPAPPQPGEFSLAELLGEIRREWVEQSSLREEQFVLELSDDLPDCRADATQIRKLFDEVIRNAVESIGDKSTGCLIVNCRADLTDERIVASIRDNGCGMSPEVLERAMDPFFSYRPAGRGRGLGLSRAARYAEINGGRIRLSSTAGEGTTVQIELRGIGTG